MGDPDSRSVDFVVHSDPGVPLELARHAATIALARHQAHRLVEVVLLDDDEMRRLNREWRGLDEPTDVLSFPSPEFPHAPLGAIAIAVGVATRQAAIRAPYWTLESELALLTVHGLLHLLGYDDETPEALAEMDRETEAICADAGITLDRAWRSMPHEVAP